MSERKTIAVPQSEIELQNAFMQSVKRLEPVQQTYHIITLGCQMNVRDSQTISGMLDIMGFTAAPTREEADIILYNTCCVRENAENRALGNVIWLKELKKDKPELKICVGGCMMQEAGVADRLTRQYPFIDMIFGTHNLYRFPELMFRMLSEGCRVAEVLDTDGAIAEGLPVRRANGFQGYISIMQGCNNFCSYCIVPYVRGRERSRCEEDILTEAKTLLDDGVKEITLLGQNVNSYNGGGAAFARLLEKLDRLGVERIRFMTSHPKDLSDDLIGAFASIPHLARHLHLPVQAGNDRILSEMNRRYTREQYLTLVDKMHKIAPDVGLTSDIIVGFPGETESEFEDTMSLVQAVRFDAAFTFIYSPRIGTKAANMPDDTPASVKTERIERLIKLQQQIGYEILCNQVGKVERVLVEAVSTRDDSQMCGKTSRSHMVNFPGNTGLIGQFVDVKIQSAMRNTLRGELL